MIKKTIWLVYARLLSLAYGFITRTRHSLSPDEWRAICPSFSHLGEDRILEHLFCKDKQPGTYVDVGAFDPCLFSNTLLLHKVGWSGVNIDASAETIRRFDATRPGDINVCSAVSDVEKELKYATYDMPGTNRLIGESGDDRNPAGSAPLRTHAMRTRSLTLILDGLRRPLPRIDFLNIDVEGEDINVLRGLDLKKYHPRVIAIEALDEKKAAEIRTYLRDHGYSEIARTIITYFYIDDDDPTLVVPGRRRDLPSE